MEHPLDTTVMMRGDNGSPTEEINSVSQSFFEDAYSSVKAFLTEPPHVFKAEVPAMLDGGGPRDQELDEKLGILLGILMRNPRVQFELHPPQS